MSTQKIAGLFLIFALAAQSFAVLAFETDQYNLPPEPLADIGAEVSDYVAEKVTGAVAEINAEINAHEDCLNNKPGRKNCGSPERERKKLAELRSEATPARKVFGPLGGGFPPFTRSGTWMESHEFAVSPARYKPPYGTSIFRAVPTNYLTISETVRLFDVEFGTDKIAHFFQQGYTYYKMRERSLAKGAPETEAAAKPVRWGRQTENTYYGTLVSGVFSNADLAANYAGMKFYENLTREIRLGERTLPPLLLLKDGLWTIRGGTALLRKLLLKPFISEHFNEALNPSIYSVIFGLRSSVRRSVRVNACPQWRERYAGLTAADFKRRTGDLKLWHGEDYGFKESAGFITISATCFDAPNSMAVNRRPAK